MPVNLNVPPAAVALHRSILEKTIQVSYLGEFSFKMVNADGLIEVPMDCFDDCLRCSIHGSNPSPCCDCCNPNHPIFNIDMSEEFPKSRQSNKTKVSTTTWDSKDEELYTALKEWRQKIADQTFGKGNGYFGPGHIMLEKVLTRLVDLNRLPLDLTLDNMAHESGWPDIFVKKHGNDIISLCAQHRPPPPPPLVLDDALPAAIVNPPAKPSPHSRAVIQCSACKEFGHNSKSNRLPIQLLADSLNRSK